MENKKTARVLKSYALASKYLFGCAGGIIGFVTGGPVFLALGALIGFVGGHFLAKRLAYPSAESQ
jgi:hypothetical protein